MKTKPNMMMTMGAHSSSSLIYHRQHDDSSPPSSSLLVVGSSWMKTTKEDHDDEEERWRMMMTTTTTTTTTPREEEGEVVEDEGAVVVAVVDGRRDLQAVQPWVQLGIDINGEASGDHFGWSISLSEDGTVLAVGAQSNDGFTTSSGHVRVYKYLNNNYTWAQLGSDIDGEAAGDEFGTSLSLSNDGTILAVGAPMSGTLADSGRVRVYQYNRTNNVWSQLGANIDGEANGDMLGLGRSSVSLSDDGTVLAVGAPYNDGSGSNSGHVRVYTYLNSAWARLGNDIDGEAAGDIFGSSVSLSSDGTILAVGAPSNDGTPSGSNRGHVRVYKYVNNTWTRRGADIDGEADGDEFGSSVSLSSDGTVLAVGALFNDGNGTNSGHVRVYQYNVTSSAWTKSGADLDGLASGDLFGDSVSLSSDGTVLAVGAPGSNVGRGYVRVYEFANNAWTPRGSQIVGSVASSNLGHSVSLSSDGTVLAAGVPYLTNGQVQVYQDTSRQTTTSRPSPQPTMISKQPSSQPSLQPTSAPTSAPATPQPSFQPTSQPTVLPTSQSTTQPPSLQPTISQRPSSRPSSLPTSAPTFAPATPQPSFQPTSQPTASPTSQSTTQPPSPQPTISQRPSSQPSLQPTSAPTSATATPKPTASPTSQPTTLPLTPQPSRPPQPTYPPTSQPSPLPTSQPTLQPTTSGPTSQPSVDPLPFVGGCPSQVVVTSTSTTTGGVVVHYEPGDRVSNRGIVFECKSWPNSQYCSQEAFTPVLDSKLDFWKQAWDAVGRCSGVISNGGGAVSCPGAWTSGGLTKYKENDTVSVTKSTSPRVQVMYKCRAWPYSWYCGQLGPLDSTGGKLGWEYVAECSSSSATTAPGTAPSTAAPTKSPVYVTLSSVGACPPDFTEAAYEPGDRVTKDAVVFQCKSWPLSLYCAQEAFKPDLTLTTERWKQAWEVVGHCTGAIAPPTDSCPGAWTPGAMTKYNENDKVSVTKSSSPLVKVIYKCKPWPYSWYCGQISPLDSTAGTLGWDFVGGCV